MPGTHCGWLNRGTIVTTNSPYLMQERVLISQLSKYHICISFRFLFCPTARWTWLPFRNIYFLPLQIVFFMHGNAAACKLSEKYLYAAPSSRFLVIQANVLFNNFKTSESLTKNAMLYKYTHVLWKREMRKQQPGIPWNKFLSNLWTL